MRTRQQIENELSAAKIPTMEGSYLAAAIELLLDIREILAARSKDNVLNSDNLMMAKHGFSPEKK